MPGFEDEQTRRQQSLARFGVGAPNLSQGVDQEGAARWLLGKLADGEVPGWLRVQLGEDAGERGSGPELGAAIALLAKKIRWLAMYGLIPSVNFPRLAIYTATLDELLRTDTMIAEGRGLLDLIQLPLPELEQLLERWKVQSRRR